MAVEKEALAMRWAIEEFKYYLCGRPFTVITDHAPPHWLQRMKDTEPHLMWWYLAVHLYCFTVQYCKGNKHINTDFSWQTVWNALDQQTGLGRGGEG